MATPQAHFGTARRSVLVRAPVQAAWARLSRIADLGWVQGVRSASLLSGPASGVGAGRLISFEDGSSVRERIVGWQRGSLVSYVATGGLPPDAYYAAISASPAGPLTRIRWQSYFSSMSMTGPEFAGFERFIGGFYAASLASLRDALQGP